MAINDTIQYLPREDNILNLNPYRLHISSLKCKTLTKKLSAIRSFVKIMQDRGENISLNGDAPIKVAKTLPKPNSHDHIKEAIENGANAVVAEGTVNKGKVFEDGLVVELFVDNVAASEQKKIINISSSVGSISMAFPGQNFYKASKSALNMSMKVISKELKGSKDPNRKQNVDGLIHPGVVRTEFAGEVPIPMIEPKESAAAVIEVIQNH